MSRKKKIKIGMVVRDQNQRIGIAYWVDTDSINQPAASLIDFYGAFFRRDVENLEHVADNVDDYLNNVLAKELGLV